MTRRAGRWRTLVLVVVLVGLSSAACVTVPRNSEPVSVRTVHPEDTLVPQPDVRVEAPTPKPGMNRREIVSGFLTASSEEFDPTHRTAHQYLTPRAARRWNFAARTVVYDAASPITLVPAGNTALIRLTQVAQVDAHGAYRIDHRAITLQLRLNRVGGQWRIDDPPAGLLVVKDDFTRIFTQADLYFLNPSGQRLVADPRYFEVTATSLPNRIVQELLAGPSAWLAPAVRTDIPSRAALNRSVVTTQSPVAVDLTGLGRLSSVQRSGLSAQIVTSVGAVLGSASVQVEQDGKPLSVPGKSAGQSPTDWQQLDPDSLSYITKLYAIHDGAVVTQDGPVPGPAGRGDYRLASVAVSADVSAMAGVAPGGAGMVLRLGRFGADMPVRLQAKSLTAPTFGFGADVWTVRDGSQLVRVSATGSPQLVRAPALASIAPVRAFRLSRDGTTAAIVGRKGRLYIGRMSAVSGLSLDAIRPLAPAVLGFVDISWAKRDRLIGLAPQFPDAVNAPWTVAIDGSTQSRDINVGLPTTATGIAAAPTQQTVVSAVGSLYFTETNEWVHYPLTSSTNGANFDGVAPIYPD